MPNRLNKETSPYLLQHISNPWTGTHGARKRCNGPGEEDKHHITG